MTELATKKDFNEYLQNFGFIFKKILRPNMDCDARAIVSKKEGALIFFTFKKQNKSSLSYKIIDAPIGTAVAKLPQRGIKGNLSGTRFLGKNVIVEKNKLIIIKGDNSKVSWSPQEAVKDAIEEVNRIANLRAY